MLGIVKEVSAVELNARLIGIDLHHTSAVWLVNLHAHHRLLGLAARKAEAVVKAARNRNVGVLHVKVATDRFRLAEIKRRPLNRAQFARGSILPGEQETPSLCNYRTNNVQYSPHYLARQCSARLFY